MDILYLVDRLEEIVKGSKQVPFSKIRLVDESRVWPLLDQMRISIPDEVRRAERIIREKDRTIAQAHEEADRVIALARSEAAQLTAEHTVAQAAEEQAAVARRKAERDVATIRAEADEYAFDVLCKLEQELKRALTVVENGIHAIQVEQGNREKKLRSQEEQEMDETP